MKKITVVASLFLAFGVLGCGPGPGSTPEATARSFAELVLEDAPKALERELAREEWELDCMEAELEWWADRGELRKKIDVGRAKLEFKRDHMDKLLDNIEFDVVNVEKKDDNNAIVTVKIWGYEVKKGKGPKDFYLEYDSDEMPLALVNVDGDWKIKNKD